jgi:hypothetical protein
MVSNIIIAMEDLKKRIAERISNAPASPRGNSSSGTDSMDELRKKIAARTKAP